MRLFERHRRVPPSASGRMRHDPTLSLADSAISGLFALSAAVLVIAQRMSILGRADRLIVLREGAVAQAGDRAEVMAGLAPKPRAVAGGRA